MFTFGTLDGDIEGFQEAAAKGKDENQRIDDMKDSIGGETFDMINEQLVSAGCFNFSFSPSPLYSGPTMHARAHASIRKLQIRKIHHKK